MHHKNHAEQGESTVYQQEYTEVFQVIISYVDYGCIDGIKRFKQLCISAAPQNGRSSPEVVFCVVFNFVRNIVARQTFKSAQNTRCFLDIELIRIKIL